MVGISAFEPGALVAGRYRVVERLTRFAVADQVVSGVEFEYWLAVDETRRTEVWLQAAVCAEAVADGASLAGAVAAIRRLNHPAVPAVLDFGEIEVPLPAADAEIEAEEADLVVDELVSRVGYAVLAPVEGESLAAVLLRGTLDEAEILAVLAEVAEVLELLHETELVHGHLSAYSIVLTETGVLLVDLAVALAVEAAIGSELTIAADVYALAWLACVTLVGFEAIEAEFGVGFLAAEAGGLALEGLTLELVARRRRWAEASLVARYGMSAGLAGVLIAGLSEAGARPPVGSLTAVFRGRPVPGGPRRAAHAAPSAMSRPAVTGAILVGAVAEAGAAAGMAAAGGAAVEVEMAAVGAAAVETGTAAEAGTAGSAGASGTAAGVAGAGTAAAVGTATAVEAASAETTLIPKVTSAGAALRRRRTGGPVLLGIGLAVVLVLVLIWVLFGTGKSTSPKSVAKATSTGATAGSASGSSTAPGGGAVVILPSAQASETIGAGVGTGSTAPGSGSGPGAGLTISPSAGAPVGAIGPTAPSAPLATVPGSPQLAVQQIQQLVNQSSSTLSTQTVGQLNVVLSALRQEIGSASSTQAESGSLSQIVNETGFPAGLAGQISQLIPYLNSFGGS